MTQKSSNTSRFEDLFCISIAQQLLIDNSCIRFSKAGTIEYWAELDNENDTIYKLKFSYGNTLLPSKIEIIRGENVVKATVRYEIDSAGNFYEVNANRIRSVIQRDADKRVIAETNMTTDDTTKTTYTYQEDGNVMMQFFDGEELQYSMVKKFNQNGDNVFDGRYEYEYTYDTLGNWITKTGIINGSPVIRYEREIKYY